MDRPKSQKVLKKDTVTKAPEHCVKGSAEQKVLTVSATYINPIENQTNDQPQRNKTVKHEGTAKNEGAKSVSASASISVEERAKYDSQKVRYEANKSLGIPKDLETDPLYNWKLASFCADKTKVAKRMFMKRCVNCSSMIKKCGTPIQNSLCQGCKPPAAKDFINFRKLSKFNGMIMYFCAIISLLFSQI